MTSPYYYRDRTDEFAVPADKMAGVIPADGDGVVLPLIAKRNTKGAVLAGEDNPFLSDYYGVLYINPGSAGNIEFAVRFTHHISDNIPAAADITHYRRIRRNALTAGEFSLELRGFGAASVVNAPQATTGIIPISADMLITAKSIANPDQRIALNYSGLEFDAARAFYYQFAPVAQVAAANIASDAFSQANNPNTFATIINNIDTAITNLAARTQEYVVIAGDEYRIHDVGRLQRLRGYYNSLLTQALARAGNRRFANMGARG